MMMLQITYDHCSKGPSIKDIRIEGGGRGKSKADKCRLRGEGSRQWTSAAK